MKHGSRCAAPLLFAVSLPAPCFVRLSLFWSVKCCLVELNAPSTACLQITSWMEPKIAAATITTKETCQLLFSKPHSLSALAPSAWILTGFYQYDASITHCQPRVIQPCLLCLLSFKSEIICLLEKMSNSRDVLTTKGYFCSKIIIITTIMKKLWLRRFFLQMKSVKLPGKQNSLLFAVSDSLSLNSQQKNKWIKAPGSYLHCSKTERDDRKMWHWKISAR